MLLRGDVSEGCIWAPILRTSSPVPQLTPEDRIDYEEGWHLFRQGRYWGAHEAWERLWRRRTDSAELRGFVQGLIQLTAGYHLTFERPRVAGALKNLAKAEARLQQHLPQFLEVDVASLMSQIAELRARLRGQS